MKRTSILATIVLLACATTALAVHPGTDIIVPAAARGAGQGTSVWSTDMVIFNPNATAATVTIYWLVRGQANPTPTSVTETVGAGQTLELADVILSKFGQSSAGGAFRVTSDIAVMVNAAILNKPGAAALGNQLRGHAAGAAEFGQGFEGIPAAAAIAAGSTTNVIGLKDGADYRTNIYIIDATGTGSEATVTLVDPSGVALGSKTYTLGAYQPVLEPIANVSSTAFATATLNVSVASGAVLVGASRVNEASGDPLTLNAWWPLTTGGGNGGGGSDLTPAGQYYGITYSSEGSVGGVILSIATQSATALAGATDSRVVTDIFFSWFSEKQGCGYIFSMGDEYNPPVPLADFLAGKSIPSFFDIGDARIDITMTLEERTENLFFVGAFTATGSGWPAPQYASCNGDFGTTEMYIGKNQ